MADNVAITPGTGATVAADDIGGVLHQRVKPTLGADGTAVDAVGGAGAVSTAVQRVTLASDDPAVTSLAVIDDWDESDRAKVNLIVGQAGIAAGAGAVAVTVPRVTLASDDPAVASLSVLDDWDETDRCKVNIIAGQVGVVGGSGTVSALTQRVVLATDVALPAGEAHVGQVSGHSFDTVVAPTVSNGAYSAGDIVGDLITVAASRVASGKVTLQSIEINLKAAVTSTLSVILFSADPTSTTKTDNAAYSLNAADTFKVRGKITGFTLTDHGTPNSYEAHGLNRILTCDASSQFYALIIDGTGFTLTSTSDLQIRFSGYQD